MIAITGASGFIGSAYRATLGARGEPFREIRRSAGGDSTGEARVVAGLAEAELAPAFEGAEMVLHLAGRAHRPAGGEEAALAEFRRVHVEGSVAVVRAAARAGVRRVLLASSVKAVGEQSKAPWTEAEPPVPADPYGVSKLEGEAASLAAGQAAGVEVVVMRFPLVYGPGAPANVRRLLGLVRSGVPLPLGGINNRRSMLSLGNLAAAVDALRAAPGIGGEIFFVADGVDLSTPEVIRAIAAGMGRPARLVTVPVALLRAGGALGDLLHRLMPFPLTTAEVQRLAGSLQVSIEKLRGRTGYAPAERPEEAWKGAGAWFGALPR